MYWHYLGHTSIRRVSTGSVQWAGTVEQDSDVKDLLLVEEGQEEGLIDGCTDWWRAFI